MFLKQNLKYLRLKYNYTQVFLANFLEINEVSYRRFEGLNNTDKPKLDNLIKLRNLYNVLIDDMIFKDLSTENEDPN